MWTRRSDESEFEGLLKGSIKQPMLKGKTGITPTQIPPMPPTPTSKEPPTKPV
ncbi:MAG: hypothetical protein J4432_03880 [DPANN group archaeon]|nr:hypothetical protein [DPANN group archaeon]